MDSDSSRLMAAVRKAHHDQGRYLDRIALHDYEFDRLNRGVCKLSDGGRLVGSVAVRPAGDRIAECGIGTAGSAAATEVVKKADFVIAIGSRLTDVVTGLRTVFQNPDVTFAHINLSGFDATKAGARPVIADARQVLRALNIASREAGIRPDPGYAGEVGATNVSRKRFLKDEVFQPTPARL